ncbi:S10 family peptidase [Enterovirga rhinocerotis]|uniref:Carboxypeptidase C (Cathepsin A) n=1 Tax=Enterovirga rhinocerotis TaxID=1339210 RepID=A0A4R7BVW0_9HYPH|nr:peptidase S10 [Enterovirga rhinocerotis]TDR90018.1 carboxypeptidase C (cathepsin A) [Enterovirga rhinocerotis]
MTSLLRLAAAALLLLCPTLAPAQTPAGAGRPQPGQEARAEPRQPGRALPADVTTTHVVELPGRTLRVRATAGSLPLVDPKGTVQAEIAYVAYRLDGTAAASRPVTFAFNGGPGASSAYLHLLVAGPWRLPLDGAQISPSAPPVTVPNAETWLDFTDLVFIDPVGTGYSRAATPEGARDYHSVEGDIASLSAVIARWLRENDRMTSPKFVLGESYGGFRGPLLADKLADDWGIGLSGLVLVSPVFDFGWLSEPRWKPMEAATKLPSIVAGARERARPVSRADLAEAEAYAAGEYLVDLLRGPRDGAAQERIVARVAALTGLDPAFVRRQGGRIDIRTLQRELGRETGRVASAYDTGLFSYDPDPTAPRSQADDGGLDSMQAPLSSAAVDTLWQRLGWRVPNARYELLNGAVNRAWRFGSGRQPPESFSQLRAALARDAKFRVLVAHGLTDLVTPYFASDLLLRQLPAHGGEPRAELAVYPGGHMFYTREASRLAFREAVRSLYATSLEARGSD